MAAYYWFVGSTTTTGPTLMFLLYLIAIAAVSWALANGVKI